MRIEENNKPQFTKEIEKLLRQTRTCQNIELTYGSLKYEPATGWDNDVVVRQYWNQETQQYENKLLKQIFIPSDRNLNEKTDPDEYVQIKIDYLTIYQSVEADSYWGMVLDIIRRLDKENI